MRDLPYLFHFIESAGVRETAMAFSVLRDRGSKLSSVDRVSVKS